MAIHLFTGKVGEGKTYTGVNLIIDFLRKTHRRIATNLPIDVDLVCSIASGRRPGLFDQFRDRIVILDDDQARQFWRFIDPGMICMLDEASVLFPTEDQTWRKAVERKTSVLAEEAPGGGSAGASIIVPIMDNGEALFDERSFFVRHAYRVENDCAVRESRSKSLRDLPTLHQYIALSRHYKNDLYFFCQNASELDIAIRKKVTFIWEVFNSTNRPIWPEMPIVRMVKYPNLFFQANQYIFDSGVGGSAGFRGLSMVASVRYAADPAIFAAYDSFSRVHGALFSADGGGTESEDVKTPVSRGLQFLYGFRGLALAAVMILLFIHSLTDYVRGVTQKGTGSAKASTAAIADKSKHPLNLATPLPAPAGLAAISGQLVSRDQRVWSVGDVVPGRGKLLSTSPIRFDVTELERTSATLGLDRVRYGRTEIPPDKSKLSAALAAISPAKRESWTKNPRVEEFIPPFTWDDAADFQRGPLEMARTGLLLGLLFVLYARVRARRAARVVETAPEETPVVSSSKIVV